ncbi:MAG: hypothetical protein EOP00_12020 [Pedobacter sp.]|nr:MAG: hypothetical protein EOP00_12020 [Pedobacter sp.]
MVKRLGKTVFYGIKTASRIYFDKQASDLSVPESALLIGLLKATTSYNPFKYPEKAIENRNIFFTISKPATDFAPNI